MKVRVMKVPVFWASLAGCLAVLGVAAAVAAQPASAAATHSFDPGLSLTGGCTTSTDDSVPDPSCPYSPFPEGPLGGFSLPTGIALDSYGDVYVASYEKLGHPNPEEGRIDVFDSEGFFLTEIKEPGGPLNLAVDSDGNLYVFSSHGGDGPGGTKIKRFSPSAPYNPAAGEISYQGAPTVVLPESTSGYGALAVNPLNDHLFVNLQSAGAILEYGSAEEGNPLLDANVGTVHNLLGGHGLAIDAARGRIYATGDNGLPPVVIKVFELAPPHNLIETIDGSALPPGNFLSDKVSLSVDEETGNLYAYLQEGINAIYEMTEIGQYLNTIEHAFSERAEQVAVDNGANSPNGALNPDGRYLWATSAPTGVGHAYAFGPRTVCGAEVEGVAFSEVSETEALLQGTVNTCQAETSYSFEYISEEQFALTGFEGAQVAGQGSIPAGKLPVSVTAEATGLSPGSGYIFRLVVSNEIPPSSEAQSTFKTYPAFALSSCPNDAFRIGSSRSLPDCRAYELVTPPDTGGRSPMGIGLLSARFLAPPTSPDGGRLSFRIEGGLIPGLEGTGSAAGAGDPYLATRGSNGWSTVGTGGNGTETKAALAGGRSPDQLYSVWAAAGAGPAQIGKSSTNYVRFPDGHFELLGNGDVEVDPEARPKLITENGGHIIFTSAAHLEETSPPTGQTAVYDRVGGGVPQVVSLLPGGTLPSALQTVSYQGSSLDGLGIAFTVSEGANSTLYFRYSGQTYEVGTNVTFEGVANGGNRIFYLENGSLYAFSTAGGKLPLVTSGDVTVANVSADGSTVYLVSKSKLTNTANPLGTKAKIGEENLYQAREGELRFVARVSKADVAGKSEKDGLGLWVSAVGEAGDPPGGFGAVPARSSADGSVLLFQSNANLTEYDTDGTRQVYRYDSAVGDLACLSCNPTGAPASGGANLQEVVQDFQDLEPNSKFDVVQNLSSDGRRAFFQSREPLVADDTDGLQDVYEWEAGGVGSCTDPEGCVYLISSGHSEKVNYLYAVSADGRDAFFSTSDILRSADVDATPSIYDAREGGGFAEPAPEACEGEGCRPNLFPAPVLATPGSLPSRISGNVPPKCPKGKHKVKQGGKLKCVPRKHRKHHRGHGRTTKSNGGAGK